MQRRTERKRKHNNNVKNKNRRKRKPSSRYAAGLVTSIRAPIPAGMRVSLYYLDQTLNRNNAGNAYMSFRYRMNSAYDPDPALGSGALSGFNEYAALFYNYRVLGFTINVSIMNKESFPIVITYTPTVADQGLNSTNCYEFSEMTQYSGQRQCSGSGGQDRARFFKRVNLARFEGTPSWWTDSSYQSPVTGNPSAIRYFNIGIVAGSNLVNGVTVSVRIRYDVYFFARKSVTA